MQNKLLCFLLIVLMLLLSACGGSAPEAAENTSSPTEAPATEDEHAEDEAEHAEDEAKHAEEEASSEEAASSEDGVPVYENWDEVLAAAEGTTVNWFMWGGSENINNHVNEKIGGPLKELYGVTLNQVPLDDTADAVNKVLNEKAAGQNSGGSIDAIWINGENFRTLKEAGLLYPSFTELLPNSQVVDWGNPAINRDFGVAVDGQESPWASFQLVMEHNSANVETPPQSFEELRDWVKENPGSFTYPSLPNHVGGAFVRQVFYWAAGSPDPFLEEFDQAVYDEYAPVVWDYLNEIEPHLWREGSTYPELGAMPDLLANQEIDFAMEYNSSRASNYIEEGLYPDTIRTYIFETGSLANVSYVAIPYNASNPAAAMVLTNYLVSPEYQIIMTNPAELGWKVAIDPTRLSDEEKAALDAVPNGVATLPADVLSAGALPEASASWVSVIEEGWIENVLQK